MVFHVEFAILWWLNLMIEHVDGFNPPTNILHTKLCVCHTELNKNTYKYTWAVAGN